MHSKWSFLMSTQAHILTLMNDKDPKLKINGHVRISKYRNIFPKDYSPNCSEEVFAIKIIKNTVPLTFAIDDFENFSFSKFFSKKILKKKNQTEWRVEKVIRRESDMLYIKRKGFNRIFNSWVGLIKNISLYKISHFIEPCTHRKKKIKVEWDLFVYATKCDLKNAAGVDTIVLKDWLC